MLIRPSSAAESGLLADIHRECFPHYWNPEAFTDFFSVAGTQALVAEEVFSDWCLVLSEKDKKTSRNTEHKTRNTPQGMIVYRVAREQADIITLAVRPAWRRKGIARALVEEAIQRIRRAGALQLFLDVEEDNKAAIGLYGGLGFKQISRRKLYYRQKDGSYTDALVMKAQLPVASGQLPV